MKCSASEGFRFLFVEVIASRLEAALLETKKQGKGNILFLFLLAENFATISILTL